MNESSGERRSGAERRSQQQGQQQQEHGEGNYQATRDYNRGLKEHMEKHDIEREARDAAPRSEEEARQMEEAERAGKDKARDGGGA
jgi:hypothetical protein